MEVQTYSNVLQPRAGEQVSCTSTRIFKLQQEAKSKQFPPKVTQSCLSVGDTIFL